MIKTGIYLLQQLETSDKTLFRKELKHVSITLYDQIIHHSNADELAERILLLFADERGAYKRTYQKRFEYFDQQLISFLKEKLKHSEPLSLHDVGVSDGRTALNFFEKMIKEFPQIQYLASDYNPTVYVLEKGKIKVTLSHTGKILEILFPPFVFNKIKRDSFRHYPLNHFIRFLVEVFIVRSLIKQYQKSLIKKQEILLFAPQVLQYAQKDERFRLKQHDLLNPLDKLVDIIRAMNVLNLSYFSETELMKVLKNIHKGLKDQGLFIIGSNQEAGSLVHGSVYKKNEYGFEKVFQSGNGSAIEQLILAFKPSVL